MIKTQFVKVRFLNEWMGNPINSELNLFEPKAIELSQCGTVEIISQPKKIENEIEEKNIDCPIKDKMIRPKQIIKKEKK